MAEFLLRYADPRGQMHEQVADASSEREARERLAQQGYLVYSVRPKDLSARLGRSASRQKTVNLEKFLIFNQQFVTLVRAGLPILQGLDLLADRLTDEKLGRYIQAVRDDVRTGTVLSDAFARQGVFPSIYVTSVLAGEKSGSLVEVLERYITYQRLTLALKKKLLVSLLYPCVLICLVIALIIFLVTYVVPNFAALYNSMGAKLPLATEVLIAVGTTARSYVLVGFAALVAAGVAVYFWAKRESSQETLDRWKKNAPIAGEIWTKYQVAQLSRVLGTLLVGGIPLVQALETAGRSLGTVLLKKALDKTSVLVREGKPLSSSLKSTGIVPALAVDMMEVGESTGALPQMLSSVAEFYEEDVSTRMTALLSLIEPVIMIFMGIFVAFVLVALYLPIFSLADTIR
ncbi:MAG: type II secretion system F family protein [Acidobacteriaceae bacterium]|nr:type II secretion system F family protein [Acidobacteriaceae bacterium]MBV8572313.1 type II secretion system F family protein [Acidobacteriaceae bacterium]